MAAPNAVDWHGGLGSHRALVQKNLRLWLNISPPPDRSTILGRTGVAQLTYDRLYTASSSHFGEAPDELLVSWSHLLDPSLPVLDVGCGQGRNALYLASLGFAVDGVEPSTVAVEQLRRRVAADRCAEIRVHHGGFADVELPAGRYGAAMSFGLIPDLSLELIRELVQWMTRRVAADGTLWLIGFTTDDPALPQYAATWESVGPSSFRGPEGQFRTYLEPGGVVALVPRLEVIHHWEGLGPEHRHGDGPPERHGRFEAIFRKP